MNSTIPKSLQSSATFPSTYWMTIKDPEQRETWIVVPTAGTLWVVYERSGPDPLNIYVWHQGGSSSPVNPGENRIEVGAGDALAYIIVNPAGGFKLAYQMV